MLNRTLYRQDNEERTISFAIENGKFAITLSQKQKYLNMPFCDNPDEFYTESIYLNKEDTLKLRKFLLIELRDEI